MLVAGSRSGLGEMSAVIGIAYFFMGGIYFYGAYKLNQYASRIGMFLGQPDMARLASALDAQRGFWKFFGIMTLIVMVIYLIVIIVVVFGAVAAFR